MKSMNELENMIAGWLKPIPHLPIGLRKWLGENIWWITLIVVIVSAISVIGLIGSILIAMSILGATTSFYGYNIVPGYSGLWMLSSVVTLAFTVVTVIISGKAVEPLKTLKKRGWDLLFLAYVIGIASSVVGILISFNMYYFVGNLIGAAIGATISAYFLFEIRSQFNTATVVNKK